MTNPERLLVVDDEAVFRESLTSLLHEHGYECDAAADAHQATELLDRRSYAAIISDLRMPGNEQGEFLEHLRGARDAPPVIVLTAYPSVSSAVQSVNLHVSSYLEKPVKVADLLPHIQQATRLSRLRAAVGELEERIRAVGETTGQLREVLRDSHEPGTDTVARLRRNTARELLHCLLDLEDLRDLMSGEAGRDGSVADGYSDETAGIELLSRREREVLDFIVKGYRVPTISTQLGISRNTVRNHLKRIFAKLGVASQAELLERLKPVSRELH